MKRVFKASLLTAVFFVSATTVNALPSSAEDQVFLICADVDGSLAVQPVGPSIDTADPASWQAYGETCILISGSGSDAHSVQGNIDTALQLGPR